MEKKLLMTVTFVAAGVTAGTILSMMTVSWYQFAQARPNCSSDVDTITCSGGSGTKGGGGGSHISSDLNSGEYSASGGQGNGAGHYGYGGRTTGNFYTGESDCTGSTLNCH
jgi:hypothetical protein